MTDKQNNIGKAILATIVFILIAVVAVFIEYSNQIQDFCSWGKDNIWVGVFLILSLAFLIYETCKKIKNNTNNSKIESCYIIAEFVISFFVLDIGFDIAHWNFVTIATLFFFRLATYDYKPLNSSSN